MKPKVDDTLPEVEVLVLPCKPAFGLPDEEPEPLPQCSVKVDDPPHNAGWRVRNTQKRRPTYDPERCQCVSAVKIDGRPLCKRHAGIVALEWLVKATRD